MTTPKRRATDRFDNGFLLFVAGFMMFMIGAVMCAQAEDEPDPKVWTRNDGKQIEVPYGKRIVLVPWYWQEHDICVIRKGAMNPAVIAGPKPDTVCPPRDVTVSPAIPIPGCP